MREARVPTGLCSLGPTERRTCPRFEAGAQPVGALRLKGRPASIRRGRDGHAAVGARASRYAALSSPAAVLGSRSPNRSRTMRSASSRARASMRPSSRLHQLGAPDTFGPGRRLERVEVDPGLVRGAVHGLRHLSIGVRKHEGSVLEVSGSPVGAQEEPEHVNRRAAPLFFHGLRGEPHAWTEAEDVAGEPGPTGPPRHIGSRPRPAASRARLDSGAYAGRQPGRSDGTRTFPGGRPPVFPFLPYRCIRRRRAVRPACRPS